MPTNSKLWQRIADFEIDNSGHEVPLSARLARANGWSPEKSRAAIEEYKKFIYLVCVAPSPLTPSEVVDQVWHLHLVDTRSYWTDLCEGVLGRPIHPEPITGGTGRTYHILDHYADARSLYASEFECSPPAEFWPPVSERFAAAPRGEAADRNSRRVFPAQSGYGSILW